VNRFKNFTFLVGHSPSMEISIAETPGARPLSPSADQTRAVWTTVTALFFSERQKQLPKAAIFF
jgi:hypothetical protein